MKNLLLRYAGRFGLRLLGFRLQSNFQVLPRRAVTICAPHTSYTDIFVAYFCLWAHSTPASFFIAERTMDRPLIGAILRKLNAIRVDRSQKNGLVDACIQAFQNNDSLVLGIAPEGGRSRNNGWSSGFWQIAKEAGVPIAAGYVDFKTRTTGFIEIFDAKNIDSDMEKLRKIYCSVSPKHQKRMSKVELYKIFSRQ